jgi:hypothetical protein
VPPSVSTGSKGGGDDTGGGGDDGGDDGGGEGGEGGKGGGGDSGAKSPAFDQPFPFRDPCSTGFGGRFLDSFDYLKHETLHKMAEAYHALELAVPVVAATGGALYLESAARHGATPWLFGDGALLGERGAVHATEQVLTKGSPYALAVAGGYVFAAGVDAWFANAGCR